MNRRGRLRHAVLAVLCALAFAAGMPAFAEAAGATGATGISPTPSLLTPPSTTPNTTPAQTGPYTVAPATSSTSTGGLSSAEEIGIFLAAGILLFGIWRFIVSDARGHTPSKSLPSWEKGKGSVRPIEHRIKSSRAKAKRERRARRASR